MRTYFLAALTILLFISFLACAQDKNDDNATDDDDDSSPPCEPTCWQHSPEQATGSLGQMELWANICTKADSGCPDRYCVATRLEFYHAPDDLKYSIQCESAFISDEINNLFCSNYSTGGMVWDNFHLGPHYGMLVSDKNGFICDPVDYSAWSVTGWAMRPGGFEKKWAAKKIDDALAHDIATKPCEEITDLRTCIRSFNPPDIHCTPVFSQMDYATFIGCEATQEPFGRPLGWREMYQE